MNVVISGTSSGIGKAAALKFLSCGHAVMGLDLRPAAIEPGKGYRHFVCDVSRRDTLPELPCRADIVVCNAGTAREDAAIAVNLGGCMNVAEAYAVHPGIRSVVITGSLAARSGLDTPAYAASQGGKIAYMRNLALRLGHAYRARVNSVSFGAVMTNLEPWIVSRPDLVEAVASENLLHRWTTPEEAARWLYFVAVEAPSLTGQDILVDNGEEANYNWIHP